jgi:hypothetical protein
MDFTRSAIIFMYVSKKGQRIHNDLQNTIQKTKDRTTRTPLKTGGELGSSERVSSSCSTNDTHRVTVKRYEDHLTPVFVNKYIIG